MGTSEASGTPERAGPGIKGRQPADHRHRCGRTSGKSAWIRARRFCATTSLVKGECRRALLVRAGRSLQSPARRAPRNDEQNSQAHGIRRPVLHRHCRLDCWMRFVPFDNHILVAASENVPDLRIELEPRQGSRRAAKLQMRLLEMIPVQMRGRRRCERIRQA